MRKLKRCGLAGVAGLSLYSFAFGADPSGSSASSGEKSVATARDSEVIETVVVTAERRSTSLQKTPLSIQAFTADSLEKTGTGSNMDLQMQVPGMVMSNALGFGQIYIRGIGNDSIGAGVVEGGVAVYVDGVYQSRPIGAAFNFVDVERIEVLKGPQGTLYGKNATGGAVNIISRLPSREKEGQVDVQFGSYSQKILRGSFSGPISDGAAYGRLSLMSNKDDGYTKNIFLNTRGNSNDIQAVRGALELTPSNKLNAVINANYFDSTLAPLWKSRNTLISRAYSVYKADWIEDPYTVKHDIQSDIENKQYGINATIRYDMDWARLTSVTAVRKDQFFLRNWDPDYTEVALIQSGGVPNYPGTLEDTKFFSQDFTLASNRNGPLQWTGLATFTKQKIDFRTVINLPLSKVTSFAVGDMPSDAIGIGGQVSYAFPNDITLTAGTRYSKETKENNETYYVNGKVNKTQNEEKTWTAWTPKFVAEYSPTKSVMLYASATKGFKSGGYNTSTINPAWNPEKTTNLEAGIKSTWLGGKLRVNAALFDIKYDQLQLSYTSRTPAGVLTTITTNAAKAKSQGFELDLVAKPTSNFQVSGGLQILRARFDEYLTINPLQPALGIIDRSGNPLLRAPDLTFNLGLQYRWPSAFEGKDVTLRADGYHRSKIYFSAFKDDFASDETLDLWNIQLSFEPTGNSGMYGAIFVKNLTDKHYWSFCPVGSTAGYGGLVAPPRTVGAQVGYRY